MWGNKIDVSAYGFHSIADMVITDMVPIPGFSSTPPTALSLLPPAIRASRTRLTLYFA
jgi:hypothetical protein